MMDGIEIIVINKRKTWGKMNLYICGWSDKAGIIFLRGGGVFAGMHRMATL